MVNERKAVEKSIIDLSISLRFSRDDDHSRFILLAGLLPTNKQIPLLRTKKADNPEIIGLNIER